MSTSNSPALGSAVFLIFAFLLAGYFCIAAVQGDFGVLRRAEIEAEAKVLRGTLDTLEAEIVAMDNKTRRLSDDFLDLDLLDQQARDILGVARADEIIVQ